MLDASAILAFLRLEAGHDVVRACLKDGARSCTVSLAEAMTVLIRRGVPKPVAAASIEALPLEAVTFDMDLALRAAGLYPKTSQLGLSLGDRACLAAGLRYDDAVVTADRIWLNLPADLGIKIKIIRAAKPQDAQN
jgi:PIN domain nuclease of toxin-antitoxin system